MLVELGEKLDEAIVALRMPVLDRLVEVVELEADRRYLVVGELGALVKSKVCE